MRFVVTLLLGLAGASGSFAANLNDYPFQPVPFTAVRVEDAFWSPRMETNRVTTVWYDFKKCEETGRIDNFAKAGELMPGEFQGMPFDDSDVFKVIEGAAYTLALHPDPKLDKYLDDLIAKIAAAQEPDGYLYTARTIDPQRCRVDFLGRTRWSNLMAATSSTTSGTCTKPPWRTSRPPANARCWTWRSRMPTCSARRSARARQLQDPPGHQEIEIGLVEALPRHRATRSIWTWPSSSATSAAAPTRTSCAAPYQQDHKPIVEQDEAVGHAVRAGYFYSGVADVAALTGDNGTSRPSTGSGRTSSGGRCT